MWYSIVVLPRRMLSLYSSQLLKTITDAKYWNDIWGIYMSICRCGPCKVMAPKFQELSEKYLDVVFLKLDCNQENKVWICSIVIFHRHFWLSTRLNLVFLNFLWLTWDIFDDCWQPLAKELGIKVVPTFKILKDSKVVKEVTGAKFDDLVFAIETVRSS